MAWVVLLRYRDKLSVAESIRRTLTCASVIYMDVLASFPRPFCSWKFCFKCWSVNAAQIRSGRIRKAVLVICCRHFHWIFMIFNKIWCSPWRYAEGVCRIVLDFGMIQNSYNARVCCVSVCLSVRPSVRLYVCVQVTSVSTWDIWLQIYIFIQSSPAFYSNNPDSSVDWGISDQICWSWRIFPDLYCYQDWWIILLIFYSGESDRCAPCCHFEIFNKVWTVCVCVCVYLSLSLSLYIYIYIYIYIPFMWFVKYWHSY